MEELNFTYKLFGGEIQVVIYDADKNLVEDVMNEFYQEALRLQKIFNFFDDRSELSILNQKRELVVSQDLLKVIKKGIKFSELTNGKYDISLGRKFLARKKEGKEISASCSYKDIEIEGDKITLKNKDVMIDLGSIAKGYITDRLADFLKNKGVKEFLIDSRGDIIVSGSYEHLIGIQNPRDKKEVICNIKVKNKGIATSGDYKQYYKSYDNSHIINANNSASITVLSEKLEDADVYATALFVANSREKDKIINLDKNVKVFVIDKNLKAEKYNNFEEVMAKWITKQKELLDG